jgi:phosphoglycerol transferase MdoB-like AlkP superfamily enzyme
MNKKLGYFSAVTFYLSLLLYWLLLSTIDRALFLFSVTDKIEQSYISAFVDTSLAGYRLDFSLAGYLLVLPFLFFALQLFFIRKAVSKWWLRAYVMVPTFLFAAISISNIPLYQSWGEKISKRAIGMAVDTPEGVTASLDWSIVLQAVIGLVIFFGFAHYFYHLVVVRFANYSPLNTFQKILVFLIGLGVVFTMIRGGYGRANLNPSVAYYSESSTLNHTAVNTYWAFLKDLTKSGVKNPYNFMDGAASDSIVDSILKTSSDSILPILDTNKPNVVVILLEGIVAQVFEPLGGEKGITPGMNNLMKEGITFTRAYAAADRSDKGMIATFSGFPAQGSESIIKYISKHERLPAIMQLYDSLGYSTSFYHGGQSEFYNFKSYMLSHGVDRVVDNNSFDIATERVSWGVYDHVVADRMLQDLYKEVKPFFSIFYTVVNHEPFDLKGNYKFGSNTKANKYRSTVYYTDSVVNGLVNRAKKEGWYDNTVFMVLSDHGSVYPSERFDLSRPERYHIPLFLFGGALKEEWKGHQIEDVVSQTDMATTLWNFVSEETSPFKYSIDLFSKKRQNQAFYNSNMTLGIVTNDNAISYDVQGDKMSYDQGANSQQQKDSLIRIAKGYYQYVFKDFQQY